MKRALDQVVWMAGSLDKKAVTAIVRALVAAGANPAKSLKQLSEDTEYLRPLLKRKR